VGGAVTSSSNPFRLSYTDNFEVTVSERLKAEIDKDPARLWVASGYFGATAWMAIGEALQRLSRFRLLLGKDYELAQLDRGSEERRIAELVRRAIRDETEPPHLASRDEAEAVAELVEFLEHHRQLGEPVVKLWEGDGFLHAKAYLTRSSVGIGSANFTLAGLERNRELVGWRQDYTVVSEVEDWYRRYWEDPASRDYTDELIATLRATPLVSDQYTPFDVLIKVLAARYGIDRPPSLEQVSFSLKWFQEDAVFRVIKLLNGRARGALLADAVGLGKTYVAMGVIHHFLYTQPVERRGRGRPVLIVIPKSLEKMWQDELRDKGLDWACDILTLQSLRSDFDVRPYQGADLVVIDEAHRLRGGGTWFGKAIDLVTGGGRTDRRVLLLTATPLNTGIDDLINELRVLTKNQRQVWAPEVADFERHLKRVEKGESDPFPVLDRSIVRRSRSDILRAQEEARAAGVVVEEVRLPERQPVHVDHAYGPREDLFELFAHTLRSLELAPYDLERFRRLEPPAPQDLRLVDAEGSEVDAEDAAFLIRPGTLAALAAVGLLVRFQSSVHAIRVSLRRLDAVLRRYGEALSADPPRILDLRASPRVQQLLRDEAHEDEDAEEGNVERLDERWAAVLDDAPTLADADQYDLAAVRNSLERDRARIADVLEALPGAEMDLKVAALVAALERRSPGRSGEPGLKGHLPIVFTMFRDTALYLEERLRGRFRVARIDGSVSAEARSSITAWFDPARRGERAADAATRGEEPPEVMITTDVLAEGHNLQLANCAINYDLHFNPQVTVQRSGRIDRLGSPHAQVWLVSFLPPEGLERHIGLLARLDERFRRIHGLGLGDEQVTTIAGDRPGRTLEQMRRLYLKDDPTILDAVERSWTLGSTDYMRQPLEAFLQRAGRERIERIPFGVSSVKRLPADWPHGDGVFVALAAPAGRGEEPETYWRFYPVTPTQFWATVTTDDVEIFRAIACREGEPRLANPYPSAGPTVIDWDLLRRAASDVADQITRERAGAQLVAGASEGSRRLRTELRANLAGLGIDGIDDLLARLLQVRIEDFDGRSGWRRFQEARRRLRGAPTIGERRDAGTAVVQEGLALFGPPVQEADGPLESPVVSPDELRLVAYEVLTSRTVSASDAHPAGGAIGEEAT
jgi:superfamily II DNA or RNA helicase